MQFYVFKEKISKKLLVLYVIKFGMYLFWFLPRR